MFGDAHHSTSFQLSSPGPQVLFYGRERNGKKIPQVLTEQLLVIRNGGITTSLQQLHLTWKKIESDPILSVLVTFQDSELLKKIMENLLSLFLVPCKLLYWNAGALVIKLHKLGVPLSAAAAFSVMLLFLLSIVKATIRIFRTLSNSCIICQ